MCRKYRSGHWLWLLLSAFLVLGLPSWSQQALVPPPSLPSPTPMVLSPDLSSMTPDQIWQMLWPAWSKLGQALQFQIEQQQQQQQTQSASAPLSQAETQTTQSLQGNLQTASQAQNQASTSTTSAITSSTASSTNIIQAGISQAQEDKDIGSAVRNVEIQRDGWKYLAIGGAVLGVAGVIYGLTR